jgi:hypothetical protein
MATKQTIIHFDQNGGMSVDNTGFVGKACEKATADLMAGIGADVKKDTKKPEYNMVERGGSARVNTIGR